jgi:hypothetical protein
MEVLTCVVGAGQAAQIDSSYYSAYTCSVSEDLVDAYRGWGAVAPYIKPKLKLIAIDIFSLNFILRFQMKIHGRRAK